MTESSSPCTAADWGFPTPLLACTRCSPAIDCVGRARREREVAVSWMYYAWHNDAQRP